MLLCVTRRHLFRICGTILRRLEAGER